MQRLQTYWPERFTFIPFCVVSTDEDEQWVKDKGIKYLRHQNQPLADKQNAGLVEALKLEWDYLIQISSDNLLTNEALHFILPALIQGHTTIGFKESRVINAKTKEAIVFKIKNGRNKLIGGNRLIKREAVEHLRGELFDPGLRRGLDFSSQCQIMNYDQSEPYAIQTREICGLGIKSETQITPWERVQIGAKRINSQHILERLSDKERKLINEL